MRRTPAEQAIIDLVQSQRSDPMTEQEINLALDQARMMGDLPDDDVEKYSPEQPRDYHGRWTTGGGEGLFHAKKHINEWIAKSTIRGVDENMAAARRNQVRLAKVGRTIAQSEERAGFSSRFKNPGPKTNRDRIEQKMREKNYGAESITDLSRATFITRSPAGADRIVGSLRSAFGPENVVDEGWKRTPAEYMDRSLKVRYADGQIGEIQLMSKEMAWSKSPDGGGGHDLYKIARDSDKYSAVQRAEAEAKMRILYTEAQREQAERDQSWNAAAGRAIIALAKSLWYEALSKSVEFIEASPELTDFQDPSINAQASPGL